MNVLNYNFNALEHFSEIGTIHAVSISCIPKTSFQHKFRIVVVFNNTFLSLPRCLRVGYLSFSRREEFACSTQISDQLVLGIRDYFIKLYFLLRAMLRYLLLITLVFWLLLEWYFSKKVAKDDSDKYSIFLIWIGLVVAIGFASFFSVRGFVPVDNLNTWQFIGMLLVSSGLIIRLNAVKTLGNYFTVNVGRVENHKLITKGIYKYLRHPSYTGSMLGFIGLGFGLGTWASLCLLVISSSIIFWNRMVVEEAFLLELFEEEYKKYIKKTKRLIPFIF